jgi:uncharacterized Ntn-hydrolase superfamily protein
VTYSLVAFDPDSGECGVAVQSHWFSVGGLVTWGEPGVGAVATQANVETAYGPRGLSRMREGASAPEALVELLAADGLAASRQVAMVDAFGGVAAHTGSECMSFCGQELAHHHSAQANLMKSDRVWGAMGEAFEAAEGSLAGRLLDALDAAEAAGGDIRGRQSAAILVVPPEGEPWERVVELRVEDHPEPLSELRRLVVLQAAYALALKGDEAIAVGDLDAAATRFLEAWRLAPEAIEMRFWGGLSLIHGGESEHGAELLRAAIAEHEGWRTLLAMLSPADGPGVAEARRLLGPDR